MSPLSQPVDWKSTGDARIPWEARVQGQRWQVRANQYSESFYSYSLLIDGAVVEHFNLWPSNWNRSPQIAAWHSVSTPLTNANPGEDPVERHEYEAELEKFERTRGVKPSQLVDKPPRADDALMKPATNEGLRLTDPSQLPDIPGEDIVIHWSYDGENNLLCHGNQILWKEPSYFECYDRYLEVGQVLLEKYGSRLKDFVPTEVSKYNLFGDTSRACLEVDHFRNKLKQHNS